MSALKKLGVAVGLASLLRAAPVGGAEAWALVRTEADGLVLESREVEAWPELRVTAPVRASVLALAEAAWELRDEGMQALYLEHRSVVSQSPDERTLFLRVRPPFIGARQCLLRQWRWFDAASGARHVQFKQLPFPSTDPDLATFVHLRGKWSFAPDGHGGARLVYVTLVDVGGVPAWLARGPQQNAAVDTVREVIARATGR